jgi:hypothetical protein
MKLEVEYIRAVQYQPGHTHTVRNSFLGGGDDASSVLSGKTRETTNTTIFSDFQKKVNLTGDVVYRMRVRLTNESGAPLNTNNLLEQSSWDLDIPLDLSLFVKMSGGQCYVGTVTSGLYFPPGNTSKDEDGKPAAFFSTIDQISPSKQSQQQKSSDPSSTSNSFMDHSFYLRLFSLAFHNRTSVQSLPASSAFTSTRYPKTHSRLEKEVSQMRTWMSLKLQYSFHLLLKVIFDTESIRNYERMFSLIMKVCLLYSNRSNHCNLFIELDSHGISIIGKALDDSISFNHNRPFVL